MSKNKNKKRASKNKQNTAKKENTPQITTPESLDTMPMTLVRKNKNPQNEKPPIDAACHWLSKADENLFVTTILNHMVTLCKNRGANVDMEYWETMTRQMLRQSFSGQALVIPSRAGAGKSTWIQAFILTVASLHVTDHPLANALGGVLVVQQKIESLNQLITTTRQRFPSLDPAFGAVLQSWSSSAQVHGLCLNQQTTKCAPNICPYSQTCAMLQQIERSKSAHVLGITQAKFDLLRENGNLNDYLHLHTEDGIAPRRFLLFDEKFSFAQTAELSIETINEASNDFEGLTHNRNASDARVGFYQRRLNYTVHRLFQTLRKETMVECDPHDIDVPVGLCSLVGSPPEDWEAYQRFCQTVDKLPPFFRSQALNKCLTVMDALWAGECLFTKVGGFSIFCTQAPCAQFADAQTLIFDATAEVDGDYAHLDNVTLLPSSPAKHMDKITFHVYTNPALNVSKAALEAHWRPTAFAMLIEELVPKTHGKTFLCTYKAHSKFFANTLSPKTLQSLQLMPHVKSLCVPYFGGTNGSNDFLNCQNVILLGYPRLAPKTYVQQCFALWKNAGIYDEIQQAQHRVESRGRDNLDYISTICPMVAEYELRHLAARLEQEVFRCAIRNGDCPDAVEVFLFAPPEGLCQLLKKRFPKSNWEEHKDVPACISEAKELSRTYNDDSTSFGRFLAFCQQGIDEPILISDLRTQLDISPAVWKDLRKAPRTIAALEHHGLEFQGRGKNACLRPVAANSEPAA